ncbi:MAG: DUF2306 domain-containing protein [Deinococcales bacterium]
MYAQKRQPKTNDWQIIAPLLLLSLVPTLGGIVRLSSLTGASNPENARFLEAPVPIAIHVVGSLLFSLLGALQFAPNLRKRNLELHRFLGRISMVAGLLAALSGVWMTVQYPLFPERQGVVLYAARALSGVGMFACLVLGWAAIVRGKVQTHQDFMLRGYALGLGAGTQVVVFLPWTLFVGMPDGLTRDILMTLGWVINVVFAEWLILRRRA